MKDFFLKVFIYFIIFAIIFIIPFLEESEININPFDYARITDVDYKAVVEDSPNERGKLNVTEKITFDIHAFSKSNPFWELWRDLVESEVDGLDVTYKVNYVNQILDNGKVIPYLETSHLYWDDSDYTSKIGGYGPGKWHHSPGPYNNYNRFECVFFYVDGIYREKPTFELNYDMYNAVLRYNDCSELYLSLYSESSIKHLNSFNAQILIPNEKMPTKNNYEAHTYGTNSNSFPFKESDSLNKGYHTFSFNLDKSDLKFKPYNQYIEFSLVSFGEDKHIFSNNASVNDYYYDDVLPEVRDEQKKYDSIPSLFDKIKGVCFLASLVISFMIIKSSYNIGKKIQNKYTFYTPEMRMDFFREIPSSLDPTFAAALAFIRDKKKYNSDDVYSAILLSLVRKGYIELEKIHNEKGWVNENIKIIVKYNPNKVLNEQLINDIFNEDTQNTEVPKLEPLTETESYYFNLILRHVRTIASDLDPDINSIPMDFFQKKVSYDYQYTDSIVRNIESSIVTIGITKGYFQKAKYSEPKDKLNITANIHIILAIILIAIINPLSQLTRLDLAFGSYFILGIALFVSGVRLKKESKKYILLTQFGEDEAAKWRGLYDFLNSETLMKEKTVIDLPLWEQYLVYATAFGISDKVIKALKIRCPNFEDSPMLRNPYYHSTHFHVSSHSFSHSTHIASSYYRSSGGHGGYGGGGRGGGGGRRRSLILIILF